LLFVLLLTATLIPLTAFSAVDPYSNKTAEEMLVDMGIGWNLGNTLEACGDWINGKTVRDYETAWGNIITTQSIIDGIKEAGFRTVRIPVAWSNLMEQDYTINQGLLERVREVVDYCSNSGLYAIVNIHWDGGWFENFATDYDESMRKYRLIWTQVSNYFKDYPNNLIFESLNEEGCWDNIWNRYSGDTGQNKVRAYNILNDMNQEFVDIVRASKGKNATRCLLIAGYATDIDLTCDDCFRMPQDNISKKLMISVHYYTPSTFTILSEDASWGKSARTWGTAAEINQVTTDFQKMKRKFRDKGVPVIIGEYSTVLQNKEHESVVRYISTVCEVAYDMGFCPVFWDNGEYYSREQKRFRDPDVADIFLEYKDDIKVTPTPVEPTPSPGNILKGDLDGDGVIDSMDLVYMKKYLLKTVNDFPSADGKYAADLDANGSVDSMDLTILKRYLLKIITDFPS
ncbi:MAG: cellulase family glycosylhydrolase, partial [Clostridium sp.]|nr:cellulase family glycosylhydrolase [Clostridium sp.]